MATLQNIKRRIKSVKNTQQITRAMKMVAAAKLRRAQEDVMAARPYTKRLEEVVSTLVAGISEDTHPLLRPRGKARIGITILTSDRGLCGGFNSSIIKTGEIFMDEQKESEISLNLIGKKGIDHFQRTGMVIINKRTFGSGRTDYGFASSVAMEIIDSYTKEDIDEAYIAYSKFRSALSQQPVIQRLLPIAPRKKEEDSGIEYIFEPSEAGIIEELLPRYIKAQVFVALLESQASEHGARMTAMDSASKNATEMIDSLTLQFNRVRQAAITKELMEIIGGAEALKG